MLILRLSLGLIFVGGYNPEFLKDRIASKTKKMISSLKKRKTYFLFFITLISTQLFAQDEILTEAEEMPYFAQCAQKEASAEDKRYCSNKSLIQFISNQLIYPEEAKKKNISGMFSLQVCLGFQTSGHE